MTDWTAIPRYAWHPAYIITLTCGHHRVSSGPAESINHDLAVYECWCDIWYQKAVRICVIP